jgi:hypothetical protein
MRETPRKNAFAFPLEVPGSLFIVPGKSVHKGDHTKAERREALEARGSLSACSGNQHSSLIKPFLKVYKVNRTLCAVLIQYEDIT